jgi:hypothetical protein
MKKPPPIFQHIDPAGTQTKLQPSAEFVDVATLNVPAGTYNFRAVVTVQGPDSLYEVQCQILGVNSTFANLIANGQIVVEGAGTVGAGPIAVQCTASLNVDASATFTAEAVTLNVQ